MRTGREPALHYQGCDVHGSAVPTDDDDAALRYVMMDPIALRIIADGSVFRDTDVFVEHGAADFGTAADVAVVQNHAVFHHCPRMEADAAAQHGIAHRAAGENAAAGDDRIDSLPAPVLLI